MNQIKIGKFIAKRRKIKKLTQSELGEKLGVSYKAVSKWETGVCLPDPSIYENLCNLLEITKDELFSGDYKEKKYNNKIEFVILIMSLIIILISLIKYNYEIKTIILNLVLVITIFIFNKNINILINLENNNSKIKKIKYFNYFLILAIPIITIMIYNKEELIESDFLSIIIICLVMIIGGFFLRNMPYNKYFGFRLPWTIRDESTWVLAHKTLFINSFPATIVTIICSTFLETKEAILSGILFWIVIPGIISLYHYYKKNVK